MAPSSTGTGRRARRPRKNRRSRRRALFGCSSGSLTLATTFALVVGGLALVLAGVAISRHRHREGARWREVFVRRRPRRGRAAAPRAARRGLGARRTRLRNGTRCRAGTANTPPRELRGSRTPRRSSRASRSSRSTTPTRASRPSALAALGEERRHAPRPAEEALAGVVSRRVARLFSPTATESKTRLCASARTRGLRCSSSSRRSPSTPRLLVARWVAFLSVMAAIGRRAADSASRGRARCRDG